MHKSKFFQKKNQIKLQNSTTKNRWQYNRRYWRNCKTREGRGAHTFRKNLSLIDDVEDNTKKWQRLLNVAIAFIRIRNLKQFSDMVDEKLPLILELAGARLLMPKEFAIKDAEEYGFLVLPAKQIQKIKEAKSVYLGPPPELGLTLFSNPKASIAVISLPENLPAQISGSVLLLAGRDKNSFQLGNTDAIFSNLSNIIGTCLATILSQKIEKYDNELL
ncbi:MAG: hypothetical protein CM15mP117_22810 [Alphaproteobacteria bacterium]|nr:MAG: hypothetical protein CM15mP117_22810 [Alphaproteobacteria bacterium]